MIGLAKNERLIREIEAELKKAEQESQKTGKRLASGLSEIKHTREFNG